MSRTSSTATGGRVDQPGQSCPLCRHAASQGLQGLLRVDSVLLSHLRVLELENRELRARAEDKHLSACTACSTLEKENDDLRELITQHEKTISELKERANRSSSNSSCPPSSDPPDAKRYPKKRRASGRKRGGQPKHPGAFFKPYTADEADITYRHHQPDLCSHCGHTVFGEEVGQAEPHQVVEPPNLKPQVTEHRLHSRRCALCKGATRARLPKGVSSSNFGSQTSAIVCLLTGSYSLSRRHVANLMRDLFGIRMSLGVIPTIEQRMVEALAKPVSQAKESVKQAARVHNDATGWKENGKRRYAFVSVTPDVVTFDIKQKHNADVVDGILGANFKGILVSDRHSIYSGIPLEQRQICNSHTDRDFRKIDERGGESKPIGEQGAELQHQLFHQWHRLERGEITRTQLQEECASIEGAMKQVLTQGIICCQHTDNTDKTKACIHKKTQRTSKNLLDVLPSLFTFARHENVEPTNNAAEQAARVIVIKRKLSFGSKSDSGNRYIESMLTAVATLAKQGRHVLTFLVAAVAAMLHEESPPSLLREAAGQNSASPDSDSAAEGAKLPEIRPPPKRHSNRNESNSQSREAMPAAA